MVQYDDLDAIFTALADSTRRRILVRLAAGPATLTELAVPARMSLTGIGKHVQILEAAGLVLTAKVGRSRQCRLGPADLVNVGAWIADYQYRRRQGAAAPLPAPPDAGESETSSGRETSLRLSESDVRGQVLPGEG